jgi:RNA polymerase sigma-70 factor (ECF subfamily)
VSEVDLLASSLPGAADELELSRSRALLERARAGEHVALAELLARHEPRLRRIVEIRLGEGLRQHLDATDVVQETYRAALQSLATLDLGPDRDLLAWLARVAVHRIQDEHDRLHAQKRDVRREVELAEPSGSTPGGPPELAASATSPSEGAARSEVRALVDAGVRGLPPDYREAILLRDYCGASWEHVARELGRPTVHAAQQLHQRAWIKLRRALEPRLRGMG